jgi:catechol 2,3-dioxygenase-like lactoylglutathione lyase family enzyme
MRWTHLTLPVSDLDGSVGFFTGVCGLSVVRDRRLEGGSTVWVGPSPKSGEHPEFVIVLECGEVRAPLDHLGFQCDDRSEVTAIAERARAKGDLVSGPRDAGGSVGYYAVVREPSGHLVEFTHGQPLKGLAAVHGEPSSGGDIVPPRVTASFNNDAGDHCVDIFLRDDGSFGFEEYRRDPEDLQGWFSLRRYGGQVFASEAAALHHARATVQWLCDKLGSG